jgi:hypothetical protein
VLDAAVVQHVHLAECLDAIVNSIIGKEIVAGQYIEHIATLFNFSDVMIGQVGLPRTNRTRPARQHDSTAKCQQGNAENSPFQEI